MAIRNDIRKVDIIKKIDVGNLVQNKDGDYLVPEGYQIFKIESVEDRLSKRLLELEEQFKDYYEPTDDELIEEGRMMHPYYMLLGEINDIKKQLK